MNKAIFCVLLVTALGCSENVPSVRQEVAGAPARSTRPSESPAKTPPEALAKFSPEEVDELKRLVKSEIPEDRDKLLGFLAERLLSKESASLGIGCSSDKRIAVISFYGKHDEASQIISSLT